MSDATTTGVATGAASRKRRSTVSDKQQQQELHEQQQKLEQELPSAPPKTRSRRPPPKYRHVEATHSLVRPSCLSHDSNTSPSFLGFRNLMVIVLGTYNPVCMLLVAVVAAVATASCMYDVPP